MTQEQREARAIVRKAERCGVGNAFTQRIEGRRIRCEVTQVTDREVVVFMAGIPMKFSRSIA